MCGACGPTLLTRSPAFLEASYARSVIARFVSTTWGVRVQAGPAGWLVGARGRPPTICASFAGVAEVVGPVAWERFAGRGGTAVGALAALSAPFWAELHGAVERAQAHRATAIERSVVPTALRTERGGSEVLGPPERTRDLFRVAAGLVGHAGDPDGTVEALAMEDLHGRWALALQPSE
jgi:hypothetical protein